MINYTIGNFFGILFTFGVLVFLMLIGLKGIFMLVDRFNEKGIKGIIIHQHLKDKR